MYYKISLDIILRSLIALITSFLICYIIFPIIIKILISYKVNQVVRNDGPKTHIIKNSTPTIGGIIILISVFISTILWARIDNKFIILLLSGTLYFGCLGLYDDYLKLKSHNSKGLNVKTKFLAQIFFACFISFYLFIFPVNKEFSTIVLIPFFKNYLIQLSYLYYMLLLIIIIGSSNAVNLTDGLDGLAVGNVTIIACIFSIIAYLTGTFHFAQLLHIIYIPQIREISVFLLSIVGASLGFLWYNSYPAEIFMGDTGSLFLGGVIGMTALFIKQELLLIILGGVFVVETMSVMLQVFCYKKLGRRIFKMAPLHHHFELQGVHEIKITIRFWILGIICAILSLISIFI
jgi:phospho-N-acetylmuramoyl-pentapeptide-transferase